MIKAVNKVGGFFSRVVFRNISILITLGLIRLLFGPIGWIPNDDIYFITVPLVNYFLPVLFAYTAGKMIGEHRGGVAAAFLMFVITLSNSSQLPMILPAMIIGPSIGYTVKKLDSWLEGRVKPGFELLVHNFLFAIMVILLMIICFFWVIPTLTTVMDALLKAVKSMTQSNFLPLVAIIIEPGKVLFFNNVINHGILEPIGIQQAHEMGKSLLFLLETNPGPGLGMLLAYFFHKKGTERNNLKSSIVIHTFGGIHEVYFPFVLAKPLLIVPLIFGGIVGNFIFQFFYAGLVATPSPGSLILMFALSPKGMHLEVIVGFLASGIITFMGAYYVLSRKSNLETTKDLDIPVESEKNSVEIPSKTINKVCFACDAGMGSSAMGAALLRKKLKKENILLKVESVSVDEIPKDADVVITVKHLTDRARNNASYAQHISVDSFVDEEFYDEFVQKLKKSTALRVSEKSDDGDNQHSFSFSKRHILINQFAEDKWKAIEQASMLLERNGNTTSKYKDEMMKRELSYSTYLKNGVAIPHGVNKNSGNILRSGIAVIQYPGGISYEDGNKVYLVIAIASHGEEQLRILSSLAKLVMNKQAVENLLTVKSEEEIYNMIKESFKEEDVEM